MEIRIVLFFLTSTSEGWFPTGEKPFCNALVDRMSFFCRDGELSKSYKVVA